MSNLLKSKYLLGVMIVAAVAVAFTFATFASTALAADCSITSTLRVGSSGDQVRCLQEVVGASVDGSFGPLTKAAVMSWQSSMGLVADGVFGPLSNAAWVAGGGSVSSASLPAGCTSTAGYSPTTGAKCDSGAPSGLPAGCASTAGYSPTTGAKCDGGSTTTTTNGPLVGGAGSVVVTASGQYSSENVGEGEKEVSVMEVDVKADDNSDIQITSTKVEFIQNSSADSRRPSNYMSKVYVLLNGTVVGSADVSEFTKSGNFYSKTITLSDAIIRAGDKDQLSFAVTANNSIDSADHDSDDWDVDIINLRFVDGAGVTITESLDAASTADGTYFKSFDFRSFATAADAELTLSLENDDINDAHILDVDDTKDTDHAVASVLFDASGDSDVWVDEVVGTFTTTGDTTESNLIISAWIEVDGTRISDKEDVPDAGAVTWNELDYTIAAGDAPEFVFWVELQEIDGALDDGDTVQLTVDTSGTVAEDEAGDVLTAAGDDPVGGTHTVYDNGLQLTGYSQSVQAFTVEGVNNDRVELTLTFDVFNFGDTTLYIPNVVTQTDQTATSTVVAPAAAEGIGYHIQSTSALTPTAGSDDVSATLTETDTDLDEKTNSFELKTGKTGTLKMKVTVGADETPSIDNVGFRALLTGFGWATSDVATSAVVWSSNLGDYKTDYATVAD